MNKKIIYTQKYQMPSQQNMVRFYQNPTKKYQKVNQTMKYIPDFPRSGGTEFGPGGFNAEQYQNAITRDSTAMENYIQENPIRSYFMGSNQDHASSAGSLSGNLQMNREWLHKLLGFDFADTKKAAEKLNTYQAPMSPGQRNDYFKRDENKYSLHRQPRVKNYQSPTGGADAEVDALIAENSGAPGDGGGGGNMDSNQLAGYANMVNFGINAFSNPSADVNTNPNAGLQTTTMAPSDAPISTLEEGSPIDFSENYAGNSMGINQLDYQDYQNIINGNVPADIGTSGYWGAGAEGAVTGFQTAGPVGAALGFITGFAGGMYGDSKNEDARNEIRANLTAQNNEQLGSSTVAMKKSNDSELARFLV